jgi:hypothetical protein
MKWVMSTQGQLFYNQSVQLQNKMGNYFQFYLDELGVIKEV